jgi:hypothetical protein
MSKGFRCKMLHEGKLTENFLSNACVRQGCILSPIIFMLVLDGRKRRIQWNMRDRLEDLEFTDRICLLAQRLTDMKEKLKRLQGEAELAGLNINVKKTKEM